MKKKIKIYIFGNPLVDLDNIAIKLIPDLQKRFPEIKFIQKDPNENLKPINKELFIIDVVLEIDKVRVFHDIEKIETEKIYSAHDFDLAFNLKLLKKIGLINKITIFGIPSKIKKQEALDQLSCLIKKNIDIKPN